MKRPLSLALAVGLALLCACDAERKKECSELKSELAPLEQPAPTSAEMNRLFASLDPEKLQDEPLREYARTTRSTLEVLASTLALKEGPSPPDGTDDVVKEKLKEARAAHADVVHYCAE